METVFPDIVLKTFFYQLPYKSNCYMEISVFQHLAQTVFYVSTHRVKGLYKTLSVSRPRAKNVSRYVT